MKPVEKEIVVQKNRNQEKIGLDFSLLKKSDLDLLAEFFEEIITDHIKRQNLTKKVPP